jgi:hypothetical protein
MVSLRVMAIEARGIPRGGGGGLGSPARYAVLRVGHLTFRTLCKPHTSDPIWNESFTFAVVCGREVMTAEVWGKDLLGGDMISHTAIPLAGLMPGVVIDDWFRLSPVGRFRRGGSIHLQVQVQVIPQIGAPPCPAYPVPVPVPVPMPVPAPGFPIQGHAQPQPPQPPQPQPPPPPPAKHAPGSPHGGPGYHIGAPSCPVGVPIRVPVYPPLGCAFPAVLAPRRAVVVAHKKCGRFDAWVLRTYGGYPAAYLANPRMFKRQVLAQMHGRRAWR